MENVTVSLSTMEKEEHVHLVWSDCVIFEEGPNRGLVKLGPQSRKRPSWVDPQVPEPANQTEVKDWSGCYVDPVKDWYWGCCRPVLHFQHGDFGFAPLFMPHSTPVQDFLEGFHLFKKKPEAPPKVRWQATQVTPSGLVRLDPPPKVYQKKPGEITEEGKKALWEAYKEATNQVPALPDFPSPASGGSYKVGTLPRPGWDKDGQTTRPAFRTREEALEAMGVKGDDGKDRWDLLPWEQVRDVVKVLTFGAKKYSPDNWQKVPDGRNRYFSAAFRHILAAHGGEKLDPESGLSHWAHAVCCILFAAWFDRVDP
jgi:hypothetical protein